MTFDEWFKKENKGVTTLALTNNTYIAAKEAWNAAIAASLEELDTHWYSKDKAQRSVQDLLTQD